MRMTRVRSINHAMKHSEPYLRFPARLAVKCVTFYSRCMGMTRVGSIIHAMKHLEPCFKFDAKLAVKYITIDRNFGDVENLYNFLNNSFYLYLKSNSNKK